jgi:hypothetical protein
MKKITKIAATAALLIAFLAATSLTAQEWTKDQLEVWTVSQNMWEKWKAKDLEGAFANIHDSYQGWNNETPLPMGKKKWMDQMKPYMDMMSDLTYSNEPARIIVVGDAAVIHYYFSYSFVLSKGDKKKQISNNGKYSEFYARDKGQWMMIGDFTSSMEEDD